MRIAYIFVSLPCHNGGEEFFIPEILEIAKQGHQLTIFQRSPRGLVQTSENRRVSDVCVVERPPVRDMLAGAWEVCFKKPRQVLRILGRILKDHHPINCIKNLVVLPKSLWIAKKIESLGIEHIHAHWAATTATMAWIASELSGVTWSFTAHRGDIVLNNLLELKFERAAFVRFISQSGLNLARSMIKQDEIGNHVILHVGVTTPNGHKEIRKNREQARIVLCPANLYPVKGHCYLLQAFKILAEKNSDCVLLIAGDGDLRSCLENQARTLMIADRVIFLGHVEHGQLLKMYEQAEVDLVVLPSIDLGNGLHESIPVSLMEAMAHGVPVVSTRTGGIAELVTDGAGVLVNDKDPYALAEAIATVLGDASYREQMCAHALQRIQDAFNIASIARVLTQRMSVSSILNN